MTEKPAEKLQYSYANKKATYVNKKDIKEEKFPMSPKVVAKYQKKDKRLKKAIATSRSDGYKIKKVEGKELIHYKDKICVPDQLQDRILAWYHEYLVHPGKTRMEETIRGIFHWPAMRQDIERYVKTCHECQLSKKQRKKYGKLPPKRAETIPPQ